MPRPSSYSRSSCRSHGASKEPRKPRPQTRHQLATPFRIWDDWKDLHPGEMQVDSVAHAGGCGGGGHLWTITVIDVYSGWIDAEAIDGLTWEQVAESGRRTDDERQALSDMLAELDLEELLRAKEQLLDRLGDSR